MKFYKNGLAKGSKVRTLTVESIANQGGRSSLQCGELDLVDGGFVVEALAIDEKLEAASHRDVSHPSLSRFVTMSDAQKWCVYRR